jgi:hypothetical protein
LASTMEGEGFLVLCAVVIAIEIVDGADDDALINGADEDALTVVPGANLVGSEEPVNVGDKRGRGLDSCWEYLTDNINPHLTSQSKCKALNLIVKHHKKTGKVKSHLNNCNSFMRSLADVHVKDLPSRSSFHKQIILVVSKTPLVENFQACSSQFKSAKNERWVTSRVSSQDIRSFALPNLTKNDLGAFHELLAMHFYMTRTSFARIEESHLLAAIQKLRPDVTLPS